MIRHPLNLYCDYTLQKKPRNLLNLGIQLQILIQVQKWIPYPLTLHINLQEPRLLQRKG